MLKTYSTITNSVDTSYNFMYVNGGKEDIVFNTRISGGPNGGVITLKKYNDAALAFEETYTLSPHDVITLDSKIAFPQYYSWVLSLDSPISGICIDVSADETSIES